MGFVTDIYIYIYIYTRIFARFARKILARQPPQDFQIAKQIHALFEKFLLIFLIQLYMHTIDIDVKSFSGYSRDVDKWF